MFVDDELAPVMGDLSRVTAVGGVILEHVDLSGERKIVLVL